MWLFKVGFVIFPDLTQLDFTGPQQVLARLPDSAMHIVAKSKDPVPSDSGLSLMPTHTFENCPDLDLICVPGGYKGVIDTLGEEETIDFVRRQASTARYVTSARNSSQTHIAKSFSRQRTTPWIAGIGPLSTIAARASRWAVISLPGWAGASGTGAPRPPRAGDPRGAMPLDPQPPSPHRRHPAPAAAGCLCARAAVI